MPLGTRAFMILLLSPLVVLPSALLISLHTAQTTVVFTADRLQFLHDNPRLLMQTFASGNVAQGEIVGCNTPVDSNSNHDCFTPAT